MQRVVLTALGFLLTETECDRNLGADKRSSLGRGKLHLTTRRDNLKVMADGVPAEELQAPSVEGAEAPDFWFRVGEKYAELVGSKSVRTMKKRKDAGSTREPRLVNTKTGKLTEAGFKRQRAATVAETHVAEAQPRNVFGDHIQRALQEQARRDLNRENAVFETCPHQDKETV